MTGIRTELVRISQNTYINLGAGNLQSIQLENTKDGGLVAHFTLKNAGFAVSYANSEAISNFITTYKIREIKGGTAVLPDLFNDGLREIDSNQY